MFLAFAHNFLKESDFVPMHILRFLVLACALAIGIYHGCVVTEVYPQGEILGTSLGVICVVVPMQFLKWPLDGPLTALRASWKSVPVFKAARIADYLTMGGMVFLSGLGWWVCLTVRSGSPINYGFVQTLVAGLDMGGTYFLLIRKR